jgi:hypothetical protein
MALALGTRPGRRTLVLALLLAVASLGAAGTFAASYFPATNQLTGSQFQTNVLTGDPTGFAASDGGTTGTNTVALSWTGAASNFGNGYAELVQWSSSAHTCPTTATSYSILTGTAAGTGAHTGSDTVYASPTGSNTPSGAYVCYGASIAYSATNPTPTTWTSSTVAWFGFAPSATTNAARYGEYVSGVTLGNTGTITKNTGVQITYSQNTNQAAPLTGLKVCVHRDAASGTTIVFFGYSGATCSYTPATASTASTQYGYLVQASGTTGAFATDKTASLGVFWTAANVLDVYLSGNLSGGSVADAGTTWAYHVSATAPAGATQVMSAGSSSLVAENASCPVATSTNAF